ncbi:hypothetical protein V5799_034446 [Amblyomma americanum]|uniref:Uncharacterized protein n=1 Tax=Amblyomma americanum TaxID=6943 RepID=A0AAQ4DKF6_AMBAM
MRDQPAPRPHAGPLPRPRQHGDRVGRGAMGHPAAQRPQAGPRPRPRQHGGRGAAEYHAGGPQAPGPYHQRSGAAPAPRHPDRAAGRRGPASAGTAGPRCRSVATWAHQAGDAPPRSYVSVAPWDRQLQVEAGLARERVPSIFRGDTITDHLAAHPEAVMPPEPTAAYCPECGVLIISRRTHVASSYHRQRLEGSSLDAAVVRARMARDPVFAARVLRMEVAPESRALVAPPGPGTAPPAATTTPADDDIGDLVMDFDLLGDLEIVSGQ